MNCFMHFASLDSCLRRNDNKGKSKLFKSFYRYWNKTEISRLPIPTYRKDF